MDISKLSILPGPNDSEGLADDHYVDMSQDQEGRNFLEDTDNDSQQGIQQGDQLPAAAAADLVVVNQPGRDVLAGTENVSVVDVESESESDPGSHDSVVGQPDLAAPQKNRGGRPKKQKVDSGPQYWKFQTNAAIAVQKIFKKHLYKKHFLACVAALQSNPIYT